jgi:hypothetical protein
MGRQARSAYKKYFARDVYFNYMIGLCLDIRDSQRVPESIYWQMRIGIITILRLRRSLKIRSHLKRLITSIVRQ